MHFKLAELMGTDQDQDNHEFFIAMAQMDTY
jgi:hypothetical protein